MNKRSIHQVILIIVIIVLIILSILVIALIKTGKLTFTKNTDNTTQDYDIKANTTNFVISDHLYGL